MIRPLTPAADLGPAPPAALPYARQSISDDDVRAVVEALRSDWLTTGPRVERFERALAVYVDAAQAVAVSSGTAALHAAMFALEIGPGDEVIVPAMTFAATANCVVYQGGVPVFADVDPQTLLLDPASVEDRLTPRTRAVIAVDYAGQPCDYRRLRAIARRRGLALVADASHALGARDGRSAVGSLADLTTFSLHPVKAITAGEGGAISTDNARLAERMRRFRNHGISRESAAEHGPWHYEMLELGYNYRLTDFQCALAHSQLPRLEAWIARRREIAGRYDRALAELPGVTPLAVRSGVRHAYHLYVIRLEPGIAGIGRAELLAALRGQGIGAHVHYIPVHLHPFYRQRYATGPGLCPVAEAAYAGILTLPLFPAMTDDDAQRVIDALRSALSPHRL
jgi:perosamine synthetase